MSAVEKSPFNGGEGQNQMDLQKKLPQVLGAHMQGTPIAWEEAYTPEEWRQLLDAAVAHRVLPMVVETIHQHPSFLHAEAADAEVFSAYRVETKRQVMVQTRRTAELAVLLSQLAERGIHPIVAKGIVCRDLYPMPDARPSGDEDLFIPPSQVEECDEVLCAIGFRRLSSQQAVEERRDLAYHSKFGKLYVEVHTELFASDSALYGTYNVLFDGWEARADHRLVAGMTLRVPEHTDHLLYLFLHAFKHFVRNGVGLRQVIDCTQYANIFGAQVDWGRLQAACRRVRAEDFVRALLEIGRRYFGLCDQGAHIPPEWQTYEVDPAALLEDLVIGGVYGKGGAEYASGGIFTANAVVAAQKGKAKKPVMAFLKAVFLPRRLMASMYGYLERYPVLLPVAWVQRAVDRVKRPGSIKGMWEGYQYGEKRIALMKQYRVI